MAFCLRFPRHYVIRGPEDSPYHNGIYHGKLRFPPDYPFKPPSIYMITPNGRFKPNTRLCLSISDFHPDTWNPTWNLSTILTGLLSFMLENNSTYGSVITTKREKQILARKSWEFNFKDTIFCELFPEIADVWLTWVFFGLNFKLTNLFSGNQTRAWETKRSGG